MNIYMDVCCLNRPFDDQSQDKIRLEAEAVIGILRRCSAGEWALVASDIIIWEINKNHDLAKRQKVSYLLEGARQIIRYSENIKIRAAKLQAGGIKPFDSLHLAAAEYAGADIFLTTDIRLIKSAARSGIKIPVANPLNYYMEVLNHE